MTRVKRGNVARNRRKKVLERAKGFRGSLHRLFRPAKQAVTKALKYSYEGRIQKKRDYRALWISRIGAGLEPYGLSYSKFINGLKKANIVIDRKILALLAIEDPKVFEKIVDLSKKQLSSK